MFAQAREAIIDVNADIVVEYNGDYGQTIVVLGEMHFVIAVQCNLLKLLERLWNATKFSLLGREASSGSQYQKKITRMRKGKPQYSRALTDRDYLKELLSLYGVGAAEIFAAEHAGKLVVEGMDVDPELRQCISLIDQRCAAYYLRDENEPPLSSFEQFEFETFRQLLRDVVLGLRSDWMVTRLFVRQQEIGAKLAVLNCGAAHTPTHPAYIPYAVTRTLERLPVNYLIALPKGCRQAQTVYLENRDPWDFYTKQKTNSKDAVDLFETRDPYESTRS